MTRTVSTLPPTSRLSVDLDADRIATLAALPGTRVVVPAGAWIRSQHPHDPNGWYKLRRSQTVTVDDTGLFTGEVRWRGRGGHHKIVLVDDVVIPSQGVSTHG